MTATKADKAPAKPGKEVVYLDLDDDITTIVDKVEAAKEKIVALVLPKRFSTLQSIVNMRLLKRSADSADKNVVLITSDNALMPLAGAAGIHIAKNLQSKPEIPPSPVDSPNAKPEVPDDPDADVDAEDAKLDYHRSIGVLAATSIIDEPETIPLEDEDAAEKPAKKTSKGGGQDKKLKVPNFERFRVMMFAGVAAVVLLIVFIIMAVFVWPKAEITLQTEATPLSASFDMTASSSVKKLDVKTAAIPATLKSSDLSSSQTVNATGEQNNGKKASGNVTFKIDFGDVNGSPPTIPAGTGISADSLYYITQSTASLTTPDFGCGCFTGSTSIVAQSAGSKFNTGTTAFSVNQSDYPNVTASGSASGGTDDIEAVVSQADVDAVKDKITEDAKNKFVEDFKKDLEADDLYLIGPTLKAKEAKITSSPGVGKPADKANVTVKITYTALAVKKDDLKKAITAQLEKQIDKKKQKIGSDDVLKDVTVEVQSQSSPSKALLTISLDTTAVPILDAAYIKKQIVGQKEGNVKSLLSSYPGVKDVQVKFSPFWVSKVPKNTAKINLVLKQIKSQHNGG